MARVTGNDPHHTVLHDVAGVGVGGKLESGRVNKGVKVKLRNFDKF
jgi:hypothetical protein